MVHTDGQEKDVPAKGLASVKAPWPEHAGAWMRTREGWAAVSCQVAQGPVGPHQDLEPGTGEPHALTGVTHCHQHQCPPPPQGAQGPSGLLLTGTAWTLGRIEW